MSISWASIIAFYRAKIGWLSSLNDCRRRFARFAPAFILLRVDCSQLTKRQKQKLFFNFLLPDATFCTRLPCNYFALKLNVYDSF